MQNILFEMTEMKTKEKSIKQQRPKMETLEEMMKIDIEEKESLVKILSEEENDKKEELIQRIRNVYENIIKQKMKSKEIGFVKIMRRLKLIVHKNITRNQRMRKNKRVRKENH